MLPYITPALAHLASTPDPSPELTIYLWDSRSTRTGLPTPPWAVEDHDPRGEIRGYNNERIRTVFQPDVNAVSMLDTTLDLAVYWVPDARGIPFYESSAPLRTILHWWMSIWARQLVHAAAVGTPAGGVLIAGKGGSGKSTTALACVESELAYAGDDYVLLGVEPLPHVYSLYNSAKLNADQMRRFPRLTPAISNGEKLDTEKAVIYLHDHRREKVSTGFPIRAVLIPRVTGLSDTRLKAVSPAWSLRALAPSTIFQLPGAGRKAFQIMARLVERVPSYALELGTDISKIPAVISGLLNE